MEILSLHDSPEAAPPPCRRIPARPAICMHALIPMRRDIRLLRAAPALARAGFGVTVVDVEDDAAALDEPAVEGLRIQHIHVPARLKPYYYGTAPMVPWLLFKGWRILLGMLRLLRTPADVYHASDLMALPACWVAGAVRHKPVVLETYELPLGDPNVTRQPLLQAVAHHAIHALLARCSAIIVTSPAHGHEIVRDYGVPEPVVVRNIPDYQPPVISNRLREYLGLGPAVRIALYQGYLQPDRALAALIRSSHYLAPETVIVLKGPGGPSQAEVAALIAREGAAERVKIVPPVPRGEMQAWAASADIGLAIYPTGYARNVETLLPNKVFEYVMAGLPVLASPNEAIEEIITTYDVGAIAPSLTPRVLADSINALLANSAARERMRRNALAAAESELRWDVEQHRFIEAYDHLLGVPRVRDRAVVAPASGAR